MKHQFPQHLSLFSSSRTRWIIGLNVIAITFLVLGIWGSWRQWQKYQEVFLPHTTIATIPVGGMSPTQAEQYLVEKAGPIPLFTVQLVVNDVLVSSTSAELAVRQDWSAAITNAQAKQKALSPFQQILAALEVITVNNATTAPFSWDPVKIGVLIESLEKQVNQPMVEPQIKLERSGVAASLKVLPGTLGRVVDKSGTENTLAEALTKYQQVPVPVLSITAPLTTVGTTLSDNQIVELEEQATQLVGKRATLAINEVRKNLTDQDLVTLLGIPTNTNQTSADALVTEIATFINRPAQNAEFSYDKDTLAVSNFRPHRDGLVLNTKEFLKQVPTLLSQTKTASAAATIEFPLPVTTTQPSQTLAKTNDLGITQLIGFGDSEYDHSIPTRIHNVALTATKINNFIVKPGEEFSFNKALGEVSARTGFQPAYVIKGGQTVLGDGGGVCQVSTTLFRALLDGGLKITKRKPHSYRVSYYELNRQAGFDATVYSGEVDLRFVNDTPGHILIHTETNSKDLYMKVELYGTSDGRTAEVVNYRSWDFRPAPASVYFPDPTLPPGKTVQIDWATSGIKTSFTNVVKDKDGKVIREDTYNSNYIPWSAKYRQGVAQ